MTRRNVFRPDALGLLEDRVALSHAGVAEMAPHAQPVNAIFRGRVRTTSAGEAGSAQEAILVGGTIRRDGVYRIVGDLNDNGSLAPPFSDLKGTITLISVSRRFPGMAVTATEGPATDLAPRTRTSTPTTSTVTKATGVFADFLGQHGTGILTLRTRPTRDPHVSVGRFILTAHISPA